ncbi:MAG: lysophospholipid acyltransferase family protein [Pseudoxanthomonas sp.]
MARAEAQCLLLVPLVWLGQLVARLPQWGLLALGSGLTWLAWPLLGRRRRIARRNLEACFPELDAGARRRLLSRNLRATLTGVLELLRAWYAPVRHLKCLSTLEGGEYLLAALAQGKGVLLLGGHYVQTELAARLLSVQLQHPVEVMARRNNHRCIEAVVDAARRRVFAGVTAKKDVRGLLRALNRGAVVAYLADQNFNDQHAFVPFFGVQAATLTTTPELARRGNAVVIPIFFHRRDDGGYHLRLTPAWDGWPSGDPVADAARYMAELEAFVRQHPEQYLWVHRRFKTRPPGETEPFYR